MLGGGRTIKLGTLLGVRVGATPSWFGVLFVLIYFLTGTFRDVVDGDQTQGFLLAVAATLLFELTLVLHELGHAVAARRNGIGTDGIDLWLFGGLAKLDREPQTPGAEFQVAAGGPAATLAVVVLCAIGGSAAIGWDAFVDAAQVSGSAPSALGALLGFLAGINVVLLAFNLIPAYPLDGGRIALAAAWRITRSRRRGVTIAARAGQVFAGLIMAWGGFLLLVRDDGLNGVWFIVLGYLMGTSARGAVQASAFEERIEGVTVDDLMAGEPLRIRAATPALEADEDFFGRPDWGGWDWIPAVEDDGRFVGVLRRADVEQALHEGRPTTPAGDLLDPATRTACAVPAGTGLRELLGAPGLQALGALLVVDAAGRLAGVVTLEQVRRALAAA